MISHLRTRILVLFVSLILASATIVLFPRVPILVVLALFWLDKMGVEFFSIISYLGAEIVTFATVILGLMFGPVAALIIGIVFITAFHSCKFLIIPMPTRWPMFVPSPTDIIHAIGGCIAGFLVGLPFFSAFIIVIGIKTVLFAFYDLYWKGKPIDFVAAGLNIIFNLLFYVLVGVSLLTMMGL
ncbi:MAG: hypothetical protein HY832_01170 [Candidatus Aenigmarchaeota archaeon]|nr:hypothetical protein [Candidatus Aenigmarchaeota archaeon]